MTIEGTAFKFADCLGCGIPEWISAEASLCYECRKDRALKKETSTAMVVEGTFEEDVKTHQTAIDGYLGYEAEAYVLATADDYNEAGDIINELKRRSQQLEELEKSATSGALKTVATIRGWFKPARVQAETARKLWDGKIKAYLQLEADRQAQVEARLQVAVAKGDKTATRTELAKLEPTPKAVGVSVGKIWKWRETNHNIVPTSMTVVSPTAINTEMRRQLAEADTTPYIAGIEFYQEAVVRATGR